MPNEIDPEDVSHNHVTASASGTFTPPPDFGESGGTHAPQLAA